jgi:hypothetical protein
MPCEAGDYVIERSRLGVVPRSARSIRINLTRGLYEVALLEFHFSAADWFVQVNPDAYVDVIQIELIRGKQVPRLLAFPKNWRNFVRQAVSPLSIAICEDNQKT